MKYERLLLSTLTILLLIGCGDDKTEDPIVETCTKADWLGTYTGTTTCSDGIQKDAIITIIEDTNGPDLEVGIEFDRGYAGSDFSIDGCIIDHFGTTGSLDGNRLTFNSESLGCSCTGTKQ